MSTFIEYKQTLEAQLQEKKRLLEDGAKEHATHVSDLERKHVQEKDRLKKEMLLKLRETKANLLKMTDNQLDTTTKRTIAENEQMSSELAWQVSAALATPARPPARLYARPPARTRARTHACSHAQLRAHGLPVPLRRGGLVTGGALLTCAVQGDGEAHPQERQAGGGQQRAEEGAVAPRADGGGVRAQGARLPEDDQD